jgi:hypothetical protein
VLPFNAFGKDAWTRTKQDSGSSNTSKQSVFDPKGDIQRLVLSKTRLPAVGDSIRYIALQHGAISTPTDASNASTVPPSATESSSFTCELRICLPGDAEDRVYISEVCSTRKAAEKSAASKALKALSQ